MTDDPYADVTWYDARDFGLRGLAWQDEERQQAFDRFPAQMQDQVSERLWTLSTWSAGVHIDFHGAPTELFARWSLIGENERDDNMSPLARSGFDCYGRDQLGQWRWLGTRGPWTDPEGDGKIHQGQLDGRERSYRLYFPLMRRVGRLQIGCRETLTAVPTEKRDPSPIAYYGTSIVHGAGVGRPGMPHACQMGRLLDREIYNLGFCGKAYLEPIVAEALGRIQTPLYIIDPLPNNCPVSLAERLPIFLQKLRKARPHTPILLVEDRQFGDAAFVAGRVDTRRKKNLALRDCIDAQRAAGMTGLHLAGFTDWYGADSEGTVDASHPNDLGAYRMAQELAPIVKRLL